MKPSHHIWFTIALYTLMDKKDKNKIAEMRSKLLVMYPRGYIRNMRIVDMPDGQVYAIYKSHTRRRISTKRPRINKRKEVPGQMDILAQM